MLARRLMMGRPRFQREPEFVPVLSHLASTNYLTPLPPEPPIWDGFVEIAPDGAPLFVGRSVPQQFVRLPAEAPPGSHENRTITLTDQSLGSCLFRCEPSGIDPTPLEILPYGGGSNKFRHLGASPAMEPIFSGSSTLRETGQMYVLNGRTGVEDLLGPVNIRTNPGRWSRWINNGDRLVCLQSMGMTNDTETTAPAITYAGHGLTRQSSSGMLLVANRDWTGPVRCVISALDDVATDYADLRHESFAEGDVALTCSCSMNTGLSVITNNTARRLGRHYSIADVVIVEVRRTPFDAPISSGGYSNLPCTLKIRATRRKGLLVVQPDGAVEFHAMCLERYAADIAAWRRTVGSSTGFVQAGGGAWPILPTNIPLALVEDGTIPSVARPHAMSDRLVELTSSEIRMWGFDGTYLGANAIPTGVSVSRLQNTDLFWNRNTRWRTLDFGATWAQFDDGHPDLFPGPYTSVQLY
ncbi:hypothetical protein [Devosia faecipullorum]|uniref:hypothetical protein n=1 Tax=Devosia faecipullorum TaxID=2755039 RepID=UPI00187B9C9E|nr:hypothetical protein [Devosia faecipullorum]MBE7732182.1 hypothetical protein [Devosia faecipullorum]